MEELKTIVWNGEKTDLSVLSIQDLKEILNQLKNKESLIKQELDDMIKKLA